MNKTEEEEDMTATYRASYTSNNGSTRYHEFTAQSWVKAAQNALFMCNCDEGLNSIEFLHFGDVDKSKKRFILRYMREDGSSYTKTVYASSKEPLSIDDNIIDKDTDAHLYCVVIQKEA